MKNLIPTLRVALTLTVASAVMMTTSKPAQAQGNNFVAEIEAAIKASPKRITSILLVKRNGNLFRAVPKVSDPSRQTDFVVRGEEVHWFTFNPKGPACLVRARGVVSKQGEILKNETWSKTIKNYIDSKGTGSAVQILYVAPKGITTVGLQAIPVNRECHQAENIGVKILNKMP